MQITSYNRHVRLLSRQPWSSHNLVYRFLRSRRHYGIRQRLLKSAISRSETLGGDGPCTTKNRSRELPRPQGSYVCACEFNGRKPETSSCSAGCLILRRCVAFAAHRVGSHHSYSKVLTRGSTNLHPATPIRLEPEDHSRTFVPVFSVNLVSGFRSRRQEAVSRRIGETKGALRPPVN